jgi:CRP-like cAMP-binding protein
MELRKLRDKATEAFAKGRFSKAAECYEEYCRAEPKDYQARLRMGDAWAKAGQRDRAISAYQFAAEGFAREGFLPRAIAASKLILELDPGHRGIQQKLADLYARKSAGGNGVPQRAPTPSRKVELPTFTEHMAVSMGPAVAPLELPEEDEPAPDQKALVPPPPKAVDLPEFSRELPPELVSPVHAPREASGALPEEQAEEVEVVEGVAEAPAEEELVVIRGVPVTPAPEAARAAQPAGGQAAPAASAAGAGAPPPPQAMRALVQAQLAAAAPPGLAPRAAQRPPAATSATPAEPPRPAAPATPAAAPSIQGGTVGSPDETALEVELGLGTKRLSWSALSEPLISATPPAVSEPPAPAATPAPVSSAPPGLRPRRASEGEAPEPSSSFTELDLEPDDTLLHAVEEAALAGMKQRAAAGEAEASEDEEIVLVYELPPESPSVDALPNIPLFSDLPQDAFIELFERCPLRRFSEGQRVFEQGSHGDAFYVICEGSVRVFRDEGGVRKEIATLGSGAFFGEMALLSGAPRMASVESASEDTQVLEISAPVLSELSRRYPQVARALKKFCRERLLINVMGSSALFQPFNRKDRRALVEKFRAREVKKNEVIIREGERADGLYVVLSGEVEARKGDQVLSRLKEGELFGEISLLSKTPATATVSAMRRTSLLRLPREDFDALILTHPQILVLVSELSEQRLRRTEALTGQPVIELTAEELLV